MPKGKSGSGTVTRSSYKRAKPGKKVKTVKVEATEIPDIGEKGKVPKARQWYKTDPNISKSLNKAGYVIIDEGEVVSSIIRHRLLNESIEDLIKTHPEMKQEQPEGWTKRDVALNLIWHHLHGLANLSQDASKFAKEKRGTPAGETERLRARNRKLFLEDRDWVQEQSSKANKPREWMTESPRSRAKKKPGGKI